METGEHRGGGSLPRPRPHAAGDSAEILRIEHRGVSQGQEQPDALREVSRPATQVPQPRVLVPRLLCRCDWKKHGEDRRVHPKPAEGGQVRGTVDHDG